MLGLTAGFVTSCGDAPATSTHLGAAVAVTRPGLVLTAPAERAAELARLPPALRDAWCPGSRASTALRVVSRVQSLPDGPDTSAEPFALAVMEDAGATVAGDRDAETRVTRLLDRWARQKALRPSGPPDANRNYALDRVLLPTIVAVGLLDGDAGLDAAQRNRILGWLGELVESRPRPANAVVTRHNNHHYLRGSVDAAWGALVGDQSHLASGLAAYRDAIDDLRPDGSLPLETRRGDKALWYQRHAIASLVVIAEIAANQGIDLYGYRANDRDLHTAIRFLLDAIDDPQLVRPYAGTSTQDLGFLEHRGHDRTYMAWVEIYAVRFPHRPESARLLTLLERVDPDFRPMVDDYSGGNTTCLFAPEP